MTKIIFFKEKGESLVKAWLDSIPKKAKAKGVVKITRLAEVGHQIRRPEADYLRDDIYELRWRLQTVNYRILFFFYGKEAVVLSHGITKRKEVPSKEINMAIERKQKFEEDPEEFI